jgi:BirA family transcriptional regulator, biotin operon repressor / biotin---[acetyl-CoA-carboxylase] ligase
MRRPRSRRRPLSHSPGWPAGYGRRLLDEVDSTNAEALRLAPELSGPCWILARRQTAGRGRLGRRWQDPAGNFAASLALPLDEPPARQALRSFVAALALHDALEAVTGLEGGFRLKWPNDVLLNGGKLSGILLEAGAEHTLIVGIGVNLRSAPPPDTDAHFPPVALRVETGLDISPEALLDHLAPAFARWEDCLRRDGFAPLRAAFLARAARLGERIRARTPAVTHEGRFETIDADGALVLVTPEGRLSVPAADIFFS